MSEMVERVKEAMVRVNATEGLMYSELLEAMARAAIEAMREPTLGVIEAGQKVNNLLENPDPPNAFKFLSRGEMKEAWTAMIDEAME